MVGETISNYKALEKIAQGGVRLEQRVMMNIGPERSRLSFRTGRAKSIVFRQNGILAKDQSKGSRSSLIRAKKHLPG